MLNELVLLHHNEPMTTSLAIADGVGMEHNSVLVLLKKHIEPLSELGRVEFEIEPFETNGGRQWRNVYFLNEQQATLLITFMRNSEIVIRFKVALIKAFFELRDRKQIEDRQGAYGLVSSPQMVYPMHEADKVVQSDRVFRAAFRSARVSGVGENQAFDFARAIAADVTGMDLAGAIMKQAVSATPKSAAEGIDRFMEAWVAGRLETPYSMESDSWKLFGEYVAWCGRENYRKYSEEDFRDREWRALWPLRKQEIDARKTKAH